MLVHIPTMGCLISVWLGDYERDKNNRGTIIEYPKYISCTFENTQLENPEEWQEIETKSSLGKKILLYYPDIKPVFDERGILSQVFLFFSTYIEMSISLI